MVAYRMRPVGARARRANRDRDVPDLAALLEQRPSGYTFLAALR